MSGVFRKTLVASVLGARQKLNVEEFKSIKSCGISESAYTGMSDVFWKTLAAAASSSAQKVSTSMKHLCFDQLGMSKEEIDSKLVKGNQEPRPFVQFCCGTISGALGETWTRMQAQHSNANAEYSGMWGVLGRTLVHEGLKGFYTGLALNLLQVPSATQIFCRSELFSGIYMFRIRHWNNVFAWLSHTGRNGETVN
ncbi:hypothetical protein POM88_021144 [Heracleum sosnowskyi]|uniref:Uncharacterized protein n=1 Tax=Heracleum sosnowskyi TaxID=360622 RepID=A0AAD8ICU0_9APIA|nr:hypothetical protein POM88_021144 [Heracleum sosnowskyi]